MDNNSPNKSNATTYGGGESRMIYEGKKKKSEKFIFILIGVFSLIVLTLAVIGIISIANGSFTAGTPGSSGSSTIKVPENKVEEETDEVATMLYSASRLSVVIMLEDGKGAKTFQPGFFISVDGYLVTELDKKIASGEIKKASFFSTDVDDYVPIVHDGDIAPLGIALYHTEPGSVICPDPVIMNSSFATVGQTVWAIPSSNKDFTGFAKHGMISAVAKDPSVVFSDGKTYTMIYVDFDVNSSLYGAPVFSTDGKIAGMITSSSKNDESGISSIIPINTVILLANSVINSK